MRYLADLNGSLVMKRLLARSLRLEPRASSQAFDRAASEIVDLESVVDEDVPAFQPNVELSNAILATIGHCKEDDPTQVGTTHA